MRILVTGGAGFIGSHLVKELLVLGHQVVVVDNLWTGHTENLHFALAEANEETGTDLTPRLEFCEADIVEGFDEFGEFDLVYHLAALGSVPRSVDNPNQTHHSNVNGFFRVLDHVRKKNIKRLIYASSSSVYGDSDNYVMSETDGHFHLPSPYAATKKINEIYADTFAKAYGISCIGLRFFNVFGPRQRPNGPYAAVIPKWIEAMKKNEPVYVYGDGSQVRDFTYVKNVTRALIFAQECHHVFSINPHQLINVGTGVGTTLVELFNILAQLLCYTKALQFLPARPGDKKRSIAELTKANRILEYAPKHFIREGLEEMLR